MGVECTAAEYIYVYLYSPITVENNNKQDEKSAQRDANTARRL